MCCRRINGDFGTGFPDCSEVVLAAGDTDPSVGAAGRTRGGHFILIRTRRYPSEDPTRLFWD